MPPIHSAKLTDITAIKLYPVSSTSNGAVIRRNNAALLPNLHDIDGY